MDLPEPGAIAKSFYRQRRVLGILGFSLPLFLLIGAMITSAELEPSISDFFHTVLRDAYVGILFSIGVFLIAYEGYPRQKGEWISDRALATLSGIFAICVAMFPNDGAGVASDTFIREALGIKGSAYVHYPSASLFLITLAIFCFSKFSRTSHPTRRKIYITCGWLIVFGYLFAAGASVFKIGKIQPYADIVDSYSLVFWGEAVAVWAFSVSWLVKGHFEHALLINTSPPS